MLSNIFHPYSKIPKHRQCPLKYIPCVFFQSNNTNKLIKCMYCEASIMCPICLCRKTCWVCDEWDEKASSSVCCRWKHACPWRAEEKLSVQCLSWEQSVLFASTKTTDLWAFIQRLWAPGPARWLLSVTKPSYYMIWHTIMTWYGIQLVHDIQLLHDMAYNDDRACQVFILCHLMLFCMMTYNLTSRDYDQTVTSR